jgi:long-chain acyl-CoA synthetase
VKKVHLSPVPFTIENNTLTPTMKVKRNEAQKMYAQAITKLYAEPLVEKKD